MKKKLDILHEVQLTLIGGEFTVSSFCRAHEISCNDHWGETHITVIFPHQTSERQPETAKINNIENQNNTPNIRLHYRNHNFITEIIL